MVVGPLAHEVRVGGVLDIVKPWPCRAAAETAKEILIGRADPEVGGVENCGKPMGVDAVGTGAGGKEQRQPLLRVEVVRQTTYPTGTQDGVETVEIRNGGRLGVDAYQVLRRPRIAITLPRLEVTDPPKAPASAGLQKC